MNYTEFIEKKSQDGNEFGFSPVWMPDFLFDFQRSLIEWSLRKGRSAIFADCGLGKTPMQLVWAENVVRKTNGRVLILTPLAVSHQTIKEAEKFKIEARRSLDGKTSCGITVANYERLDKCNPADFVGVVCDESSILKSFNGATRGAVTEFMRKMPYRLLATATAAPNDYIELGTSSEALGELGQMDMLNRFFKNDANNSAQGRKYGEVIKWRLKGHAEIPFWRWVCSWARAIRKPSDIGFDDGKFILPPLIEREHVVESDTVPEGFLFKMKAVGLKEQRDERRRTIKERCNFVGEIVSGKKSQSIIWCHLNNEGDLLEQIISDAEQVSGDDPDEDKEEKFLAFAEGKIRVLVTKPKIGALGLNFQRCSHVTFFPSHSFEQYYQGVRRCWRFGQKSEVRVDIVSTEGERGVMDNLKKKSLAADKMFTNLVYHMNNAMKIDRSQFGSIKQEIPKWL